MLLRQAIKVVGEIVEVGGGQFQATQKIVVDQHRRHCDGDPHASGHQRRAYGACHRLKAGRAGRADALERRHDPPDRPEQADERRGTADTGQHRQARFQRASLPHDLLAQGAFEAILVIDRLAQVGLRLFVDLNGRVARLRNPGRCTGLFLGQMGGRIKARCRPELLVKLAILPFEPSELQAFEQCQPPGGDGKQDEQPDDRVLDGSEGRFCQKIHGEALCSKALGGAMRLLSGSPLHAAKKSISAI